MPTAPTDVVDALQASCRLHLTAVEHYTGLAAHLNRWGYESLGERFRADAKEERGHLRDVMDRLEYFDVAPSLDHKLPKWPRHDYAGILEANLLLETAAAAVERANIAVCREAGDEQSALVFVVLLAGSEKSILEIEAAQKVIDEIGLENYLATFAG
jgi:bacterioferritin